MTEPSQHLGYASQRSSGPSRTQCRLIVLAACFGVSWSVWLVIGFASYDPYDDHLLLWLGAVTLMFGVPCGFVLSIVALVILEIWWGRHPNAD